MDMNVTFDIESGFSSSGHNPGKLGKIEEKIANSHFIVLIGSLGHREPTVKKSSNAGALRLSLGLESKNPFFSGFFLEPLMLIADFQLRYHPPPRIILSV